MRIQHNITALNAANRLKSNESTVSKNIQKLSSGYRINSAADDAAGLAVSEKMRKQINGLSQAEDNTQNGISLIQTAEGGLNETSAILQRMNTLAVEASNGTYKQADRANLQMEITSLNTEVDRISTSTKFNEISLLDGSLSSVGGAAASSVSVSGLGLTNVAATAAVITVATVGTLADKASQTYTVNYKDASGAAQSISVTLSYSSTAKAITSSNGAPDTSTAGADPATATEVGKAVAAALNYDSDFSKNFAVTESSGVLTITSKTAGANEEQVTGFSQGADTLATTKTAGTGTDAYQTADFTKSVVYDGTSATEKSSVFSVNGQKFAFVAAGKDASALGTDVNVVYVAAADIASGKVASGAAEEGAMSSMINTKAGLATSLSGDIISFKTGAASKNGNALVFQVGSENTDDQRASLSIGNMNAASLGLNAVNISDPTGAKAAIDIISKASAQVSTARAQLGALQNELEHTANNLSTMNENLSSAESTIRDVDMTNEYVQFSKNQILTQAANSMLAQANAQPQNVLSLLKG